METERKEPLGPILKRLLLDVMVKEDAVSKAKISHSIKEGITESRLDELVQQEWKKSLKEMLKEVEMSRNDLVLLLHNEGFLIKYCNDKDGQLVIHVRDEEMLDQEINKRRAMTINNVHTVAIDCCFNDLHLADSLGVDYVRPGTRLEFEVPSALASMANMRSMGPMEAFVTEIQDPSDFFVMPLKYVRVLRELDETMDRLYESKEMSGLRIDGMCPQLLGLLVACKVDVNGPYGCCPWKAESGPSWYRGKILSATSTNSVMLRLLECGQSVECHLFNCRFLLREIATIAPLAIHCKLAALLPRSLHNKTWSRRAVEWFKRWILNEEGSMFTVLPYDEKELNVDVDDNQRLNVCLKMESNERSWNLNDLAIVEGFAAVQVFALDPMGYLPWQNKELKPNHLSHFLHPKSIVPMDLGLFGSIIGREDFEKEWNNAKAIERRFDTVALTDESNFENDDESNANVVKKVEEWLENLTTNDHNGDFKELHEDDKDADNDAKRQDVNITKTTADRRDDLVPPLSWPWMMPPKTPFKEKAIVTVSEDFVHEEEF